MDYAPIVMFVYNRADHFTQRHLQLLGHRFRRADRFSDRFEPGRFSGHEPAVFRPFRGFSRPGRHDFLDMIIIESPENKGLAKSVISGVTKVINKHGSVIVVEDDCVPSPYFLNFMNSALCFYKDDKRVGSIAGYAPPIVFPETYQSDVFAAYRSCSWGWATWKEIWDKVDWELTYMQDFYQNPEMIKKLNSFGSDRFMRLYRNVITNANSWSVKFGNIVQPHPGRRPHLERAHILQCSSTSVLFRFDSQAGVEALL